ncbi:TetR family transcriptional regulator [Nonomuraea jabiensis]|uniref:TetR/AcrR family transcriptional regulator n=1 Tax=Nonomuraea jabiensis TaxID=882448 RepID=UPI003D7402EB
MHEPTDTPAPRRTGRWRTGEQSRQRILDAARARFAQDSYERATVRAIAADADVEVAMVYYFFGSKEKLFAAALNVPEHPLQQLQILLEEGLDDIGHRLVRRCLELWDTGSFEPVLALWRSGAGLKLSQSKMAVLKTTLQPSLDRLAGEYGMDDAELRLELVMTYLMGLVIARYQLKLDHIAAADREDLVAWHGPTVQHYLTSPAPASSTRPGP